MKRYLADTYENTLNKVQQIASNMELTETERLEHIRQLTAGFTNEPDPYWEDGGTK